MEDILFSVDCYDFHIYRDIITRYKHLPKIIPNNTFKLITSEKRRSEFIDISASRFYRNEEEIFPVYQSMGRYRWRNSTGCIITNYENIFIEPVYKEDIIKCYEQILEKVIDMEINYKIPYFIIPDELLTRKMLRSTNGMIKISYDKIKAYFPQWFNELSYTSQHLFINKCLYNMSYKEDDMNIHLSLFQSPK